MTTSINWIKIQTTEPFVIYKQSAGESKEGEDVHQKIKSGLVNRAMPQENDMDYRHGSFVTDKKKLLDLVSYYESSTNLVDSEKIRSTGNGFYLAFHEAWARHGKVVISPDDVWLAIQLQFNKYIEKNAEELRSILVAHEGKQTLTVDMTGYGKDWPLFMAKINDEIKKKIKIDIKELLPAFSSTTLVQLNMKHLAVMDNMKQYFNYSMRFMCGIESIGFLGTLDDWKLLQTTVLSLRKFHLEKSKYFTSLSDWIDQLLLIIQEFIHTYQNEPNVDFWNKLFQERQTHGSGGSTFIKGWFNVFLTADYDKEIDVCDIPSTRFTVPVKIDDNGVESNVALLGGFTGVHQDEVNHTWRPQMSYAVIEMDPLNQEVQKEKERFQKEMEEIKKARQSGTNRAGRWGKTV